MSHTVSKTHICGHCGQGLLEVTQTEQNWAGLVCIDEDCVAFRPGPYEFRPDELQLKEQSR